MTPVEKLDLLIKVILRRWSHNLTMSELMVVLFVADRTIGWNDAWCHISIQEMLSAEPPYRMRVHASPRTIRRALLNLVAQDYLTRRGERGDRRGFSYKINDQRLASECEVVDLPTRRRDRVVQTGHPDRSEDHHTGHSDPSTSAKCATHTGHSDRSTPAKYARYITVTSNNNIQPEQKPQHDLVGSLGEAEARAGRLTDAAVERKVRKAGPGSSADALFAVWRAATLEGFPSAQVMPWSAIDKSKVKKFAVLTSDPVTLMAFAAKNWRSVIRDKMSWMKSPGPVLPDIGFFLRFASKFNEALYGEEHYDRQMEMDPTVRLRRLGVREEETTKPVGGRRG